MPLSPLHPNIRVREEFLQDMDFLVAESKKEPTFIFRKLMEVLIPANNDWASAKGIDGMFTNFKDQLWTSFQYVKKGRPNWLIRECRRLISQLIEESKR